MDNFYNNWGVLGSGKDARVRIAITFKSFQLCNRFLYEAK